LPRFFALLALHALITLTIAVNAGVVGQAGATAIRGLYQPLLATLASIG
jgi:hypothetical protein